jgi:hypothetical protein
MVSTTAIPTYWTFTISLVSFRILLSSLEDRFASFGVDAGPRIIIKHIEILAFGWHQDILALEVRSMTGLEEHSVLLPFSLDVVE